MEKPYIHLMTVPTGNYVYDVNTNLIFKVEEKIYKYLSAEQIQDIKTMNELYSQTKDRIDKIKKNGFLSTNRVKHIKHPVNDFIDHYLENCLEMMTLQVTRQCNLRCKYCVYSDEKNNCQRSHTSENMSWDIAKKSIDFFAKRCHERETISIGFYGGEPLLCIDLIKKCMEYAKKELEGKELNFSLTTNGTIMNDKIASLLMEYHVNILISLDGPSEVHNRHRIFLNGKKGTFERIEYNLQWIKQNYPELFKQIGFNAVLDPLSDYNCINQFFLDYWAVKETMRSQASFLDPEFDDIDSTKYSDLFLAEMKYEQFKVYLAVGGRLERNCITHMNISIYERLKNKFDERIFGGFLPDCSCPGGPCIAGAQRLFVDVYGNLFPCERVSEKSECMNIGTLDNGFDIKKILTLINIAKLTEKECKKCFAFTQCTQCAKLADNNGNLDSIRRLNHCNGVKITVENEMKDYVLLMELQGKDFYGRYEEVYL